MKKRLDSLRIERFRQIRELSIPELGHVNLIVGGNNSGKSTVLEALRFYAGKGAPSLIREFLRSHGEWDEDERFAGLRIRNLFHGRRFPDMDGEPLSVGEATGSKRVSMEYVLQDIAGLLGLSDAKDGGEVKRVPLAEGKRSGGGIDSVQFQVAGVKGPCIQLSELFGVQIQLDIFGAQPGGDMYERRIAGMRIPCEFVPPGTFDGPRLSEAWDGLVLTPSQSVALQALRVIEQNTEDLAFVHDAHKRMAVLKLKGFDHPVPLQSMGDGMTRVLQLVLTALRAADGFLLVDEFENGLHHSVQAKVWEILFSLAQTRGLQVFATTHSNDCARAFSQVALANGDVDGKLLKLERMPDDGRTVAATLGEDDLSNLLDAGIEVRG